MKIKNIPTGAGDDIKFDVSYAKGDTKNVIATSPAPRRASRCSAAAALALPERRLRRDHGRRLFARGAGGTDGIQLTTAWGVRGAFNHNWNPNWSCSLFGSYSAVRYDGGANDNLNGLGTTTAKGAYCAAFAASHPGQALAGMPPAPTPAIRTSTSRSSA